MLGLTSSASGIRTPDTLGGQVARARQAADEAETYARNLREKANAAQRDAVVKKERSNQLDSERRLAGMGAMGTGSLQMTSSVVLNAQGQPTGRILNTSA